MAVRYNKLWKLLVDKKMSKADLRRAADISSNTLTKLSKDEGVPESFKGVPLVLISSAIMAMSFTGFSGMFS